jgi:hypothetical protein
MGRFQQGMNLNVTIRTANAANVPNWPDLRPQIEVFRDASPPVKLLSAGMASYQPTVVPGVFRYTEYLGTLYPTAGRHFVFVRWTDQDGNPRLISGSFELVGGGNSAGTIISMFAVARPDARYLLTSTDAGTISRRKNPR